MSEKIEQKIVVSSFQELRNVIEVKVANGITEEFEILVCKSKYIKRREIPEDIYYYTKEMVLDNEKDCVRHPSTTPILSDSLRMDVRNFYNSMLTNAYNRKMRNNVSGVTIKNSTPIQTTFAMKSFVEDMAEIVKLSIVVKSLSYVMESFDLDYLLNNEEYIEAIENKVEKHDDIVALLYLEKYMVKPSLNIPKSCSKELDNNETVLIDNENPLHLKHTSSIETLHIDIRNNYMYITDKTLYGNISLRKVNMDEIFTTVTYPYSASYN